MAKIFYIMGASGSGKDSVMRYVRTKLNGTKSVIFAHRYITRPATDGNENHVALSNHEFRTRLKTNLFAMHWESHGLHYGIGKEINYWLHQGLNVVVNGSREYLPTALEKYKTLQPVLIETSPEVLYKRLVERGRESEKEILERLQRNEYITFDCSTLLKVQNNTAIEDAGEQVLAIVTNLHVQENINHA